MNLDQLIRLEGIEKYRVLWYGKSVAQEYIVDDHLNKKYISFAKTKPNIGDIYIVLKGIEGKRSIYISAIKITKKLTEIFVNNQTSFEWEKYPLNIDEYSNRLIFINNNFHFDNQSGKEFIIDEIYPPKLNRKVPFFASYDEVELSFNELKEIVENRYADYYKHLSCVKGIYMIIDGNTGKQYIGSASGEEGLYGRWKSYAQSYHGNDKELVKLFNKEGPEYFHKFKYIILQILPLKMASTEITKIETKYKNKYLTKEFGLNDN